ncbi:DUF917 family protein [Anaerotruncus sp. 80]|uniref:DUF917 family protein n=1 Tax=Anaerotruncus colihominis TaxID=169435 RepID=A0A845QFT7_9FIRM|nr:MULTISPECIES: DUF917 family protein [Anaerotruncus]NBH60569.1 DUF917 family protein [Anaerotruncus colihominis]NCF01223.1 DUF917 family protein [Anaerotruncus sp. 80]
MKYLSWKDVEYMVYGGAFLAGGGGGGMDAGLAMLAELEKRYPDYKVPMISPEEMKDDEYAAVFGGIGAPTAVDIKTVLDLFDKLLKHGYEVAAEEVPHGIAAALPPEQGSLCCILPILVSIAQGIPVVDADGCDRACPGLECCLYTLNGVPFYPGILTSERGHIIRIEPSDPLDAAIIERTTRRILDLYENMLGMTCWYSSKEDILTKLVPGTLSKAIAVGKAILEAKEKGVDVSETVGKLVPLKLLAEGVVTKKESVINEGHDIATTIVTDAEGVEYRILAANESMALENLTTGETVMSCPDVICSIDKDNYYPLSTADVLEGMHVQYFGTPVDEKWFATETARNSFAPHFKKCGYEGPMVRF